MAPPSEDPIQTETAARTPPRVFVSYSYDSEAHQGWVEDLASALRRDGVDARADFWKEPTQTITEFMNAEVRLADHVVVVCTPDLREKVHATEERRGQTGVGWEVGLLNALSFSEGKRKMVPVIAGGTRETAIPTGLQGFEYFDLSSEAHYEQNYRRLLARLLRPPEPAPVIGRAPDLPRRVPQPERFPQPGGGGGVLSVPRTHSRPPPDLPFRADRREQVQSFETALAAMNDRLNYQAGVLFCTFRGAISERPSKLQECLSNFTLADYLGKGNKPPCKDVWPAWPAPGRNRFKALRSNLLTQIELHVPRPLGSRNEDAKRDDSAGGIAEALRKVNAPVLVRVRVILGNADRSDGELLAEWIGLWREIATTLHAGIRAKDLLVVVVTYFEYDARFGGWIARLLGSARQLLTLIDPKDELGDDSVRDADDASAASRGEDDWIERLRPLGPVPVGELPDWLERVVRPWIESNYERNEAVRVEEGIREELRVIYRFDQNASAVVPMETLAAQLDKILLERGQRHEQG
jgi:hypothetical protein